MIMCVLLCYPVSIHMSQLQATGRPISSCLLTHRIFDSCEKSKVCFHHLTNAVNKQPVY